MPGEWRILLRPRLARRTPLGNQIRLPGNSSHRIRRGPHHRCVSRNSTNATSTEAGI